MQDSRHLVCNDLLASDAFPKIPLDAALQFADENRTTGGVMTCCAFETLAAEVRRLQGVIANATGRCNSYLSSPNECPDVTGVLMDIEGMLSLANNRITVTEK